MEKLNPEDAELLPREIVHHPIDADLARGIGDRRSLRRQNMNLIKLCNDLVELLLFLARAGLLCAPKYYFKSDHFRGAGLPRRRTALLEWLGCPTRTGPLGRETNRNQVGAALRVGE